MLAPDAVQTRRKKTDPVETAAGVTVVLKTIHGLPQFVCPDTGAVYKAEHVFNRRLGPDSIVGQVEPFTKPK